MNNEDKNITESVKSEIVDDTINMVNDVATGIPSSIRKNMFKVIGQLSTAAIDIPIANLEGKAAKIRAETEAYIKLFNIQIDQIALKMNVNDDYVKVASGKNGEKIVRERLNLDSITKTAIEELSNGVQVQNKDIQVSDISQDWLNAFEREACDKSSVDMRYLFGKILAGEISKPSTYSIKSVKTLSQLDTEAAMAFYKLSSLASTRIFRNNVTDSRVISLGGDATLNSLEDYGLNFDTLNAIQEYGLIIVDYDSKADFGSSIVDDNNQVKIPFVFQEEQFALKRIDANKPIQEFWVQGVELTRVGKEISSIIDIKPNQLYKNKLFEFFATEGFKCVGVKDI